MHLHVAEICVEFHLLGTYEIVFYAARPRCKEAVFQYNHIQKEIPKYFACYTANNNKIA